MASTMTQTMYESRPSTSRDIPKAIDNVTLLAREARERFMNTRPLPAMQRHHEEIIQLLSDEILRVTGVRYNVFRFGSSANGLANVHSDLDLSMQMDERFYYLAHPDDIVYLASYFTSRRIQKDFGIISCDLSALYAQIPVIKLKFSRGEDIVDVDLVYNNPVGVLNSEIIRIYVDKEWRLGMVFDLFKCWAKNHGLHGGRMGGFNSYSLALLTIRYLQIGVKPAILPILYDIDYDEEGFIRDAFSYRRPNAQDPAMLFVGMIRYYRDFEFQKYVIDIESDSLELRKPDVHNPSSKIWVKCVGRGRMAARSVSAKKFNSFLHELHRFCRLVNDSSISSLCREFGWDHNMEPSELW